MSKNTTQIYSFTLILKNVDADSPGLEDNLYEAGCEDALINSRNGTVYLDFDRPANSLEAAVINAIKDVESASISPVVASVAPEDLVTESDIAKRLNKNRQTVSLWIQGSRRTQHSFPKPVMKLNSRSPLWKWFEIVKWLFKNKMITEQDPVVEAEFIEDINAVLEERDKQINTTRQRLLQKLSHHSSKRTKG